VGTNEAICAQSRDIAGARAQEQKSIIVSYPVVCAFVETHHLQKSSLHCWSSQESA